MKTFNVPAYYRSQLISKVKEYRKLQDPRKKDRRPTAIDFGTVTWHIARHFGFCYGVENAIEIAFKAIDENPGKRIFLLSQMIHNPDVNRDLESHGVQFLQDTHGQQLIAFDGLTPEDVVVIPAFGAPLPLIDLLERKGITTAQYNTTCPFVERVWKKSEQIGETQHTIIIHGKYTHEETRSTFSRSIVHSNAVIVIKNLEEAQKLATYILGQKTQTEFENEFAGKFSEGFSIHEHFNKVGVINQTTMLATETTEIAEYIKHVMQQKFTQQAVNQFFADTRDTLCYATNENQDATLGLLDTPADLALVIGGYNSSNTSHLVELCERKFPTYFIASADEIKSQHEIHHFDYPSKTMRISTNFLPQKEKVNIIITSGASCPDSLLEAVVHKINSYYLNIKTTEAALATLTV